MKKYIFVIIVIFGSAMLFSCNHESVDQGAKVMKNNVEESIRKALPVGSSYKEIESYFIKNKIEHSWAEAEKKFYAIIRNVSTNGVVHENITIVVFLDDDLKLSRIEVKPVFTGP